VGLGHIGEGQGGAWSSGDMVSGDDGRGAGRESDAETDSGLVIIERDTTVEPSGDRFNVGDDIRGDHKACGVHGAGTRGAHGM